ncbi:hypothetical protein CRYUN_Cryun05aG0185400 [Craigia yunnanensis]
MPSTNDIIILAVNGLICAVIIILVVMGCFDIDFRQRRPSQDIESGQASNPVADQTMQRQPSQKQQAEASKPIMVLYKNEQETESNCTDCAICLEEFREGDSCRIISKCRHLYHQLCIDQWLVKDRHCPLCRGSVHGLEPTPTN